MQPPGSPRAPWKRHLNIEPHGGAPPMSGTVERGITRSHSEHGSYAPPRRKYCGGSPWEDRAFRSWAALFLSAQGGPRPGVAWGRGSPFLLALGRMCASWAGLWPRRRASPTMGGPPFPSAQLCPRRRRWRFLPLVCRVLRYCWANSSISPFARFLRPLSGFYGGDAVAFSFSFIS